MNQWTPTYYATKLTEIPASFFLHHHFNVLLCDVDNTLAAYDELTPRKAIQTWVNTLQAAGLTLVLISNNTPQRVGTFAAALGVDYLAQTGKPFSRKLLNFLNKKGYSKDKAIVIGDQLLTDIWMANRLGMKSLFVERLVPYDHWPTKPNRVIERWLKKRLFRAKKMPRWEDHP